MTMTSPRKVVLIAIIFIVASAIYIWNISGEIPVKDLVSQVFSVSESQKSHRQPPATTESAISKTTPAEGQKSQVSSQKEPGENTNSTNLGFEELQKTLTLIDPKQLTVLLDDEEKFRMFVKNEAANKSVFAAAHANKVDQNEKNLLIARRGTDNILREIYLRQLIASKMPKDFPSEEQIKTYFDKNKDKFILEERLPVWQIFLPYTPDMSQKEIENVKKKAESIIVDINKNKIDFATAAIKYSKHLESKFNGGFMGMVKTSDLKPEFKKALMSLQPDTLTSPISTDDGVHILKHGSLIPAQELQLDDVHEQIRDLLIKEARKELRQAIFKQAAATYPVEIDDKKLGEWRQKFRADLFPDKSTDEQK
jgi:hypothetical protein